MVWISYDHRCPQEFDTNCVDTKGKLESAAKARGDMEKPSNTENMCEALNPRWDTVKKVAEERVAKVWIFHLIISYIYTYITCKYLFTFTFFTFIKKILYYYKL